MTDEMAQKDRVILADTSIRSCTQLNARIWRTLIRPDPLTGQWKAVAAKGQPWELYDLTNDRSEQSDMARSKPDILLRLTDQWDATTKEFTALSTAKGN